MTACADALWTPSRRRCLTALVIVTIAADAWPRGAGARRSARRGCHVRLGALRRGAPRPPGLLRCAAGVGPGAGRPRAGGAGRAAAALHAGPVAHGHGDALRPAARPARADDRAAA